MKRRAVLPLVLVALASALTASASARGETSYRLPELRETVPPAARVVRAPLWSREIDAPPGDDDVLAHGRGVLAFASGGRICGFAPADGTRRWCAGAGTLPAYAGGEIAYVAPDGSVRAVDARTGAARWHFTFPTSAEGAALEGPPTPVSQRVWAAGDDFLVLRDDGRGGHHAPNYGEISTSGHAVWSTELYASARAPLVVAPGDALQLVVSGGATLTGAAYAVRLGIGGGLRGPLIGAWETIDLRPPLAVFAMDPGGPVEDHFLTFDVAVADVRTGAVRARYRFEPDYDANYARYADNALPSSRSPDARADADAIYVRVGSVLYRYRYANPKAQRPLIVDEGGTLLGGPAAGAVYVARADGVWALHADARALRARRVAASRAPVTVFAIAGRTAYVGFEDGTLRGVDLEDGRTVLAAGPCAPYRTVPYHIGTDERRVYAVCATGTTGRIVAYSRPDADR